MIHHRVVLGSTPYTLQAGADIEALKQEIVAAIRRGGDWIRVPAYEGAKVVVDVVALVTAGLPVLFEAVTRPEDKPEEVHAGAVGPQALAPADDWLDLL